MMILKFRYTFAEYLRAYKAMTRLLHWLSVVAAVHFFLVLVILGLTALIGEPSEKTPADAAGGWDVYLIGLAILAAFSFLPRIQAWMAWRNQPGVRDEITFLVDEEGVRVLTGNTDSFMKWAAYKKIKETKDFFLLYLAKRYCQLLPKRAFADEAQMNEFRQLTQRSVVAA